MKRITAVLIALLLLMGLFAGCGSSDGNKTESSSALQGASIDNISFITEDGASVYRIVRPDGESDYASVSAALLKSMKETLGVNVRAVLDSEDGNDVYEILLGETNRPETESAKALLESKTGGRYDDYIICSIGKKIVIYSENVDKVSEAVTYFTANYLKKEGVKGGIDYSVAATGNFETVTINGVDAGKFNFVRPHYNSSYLTEIEMEAVSEYVLQKTGYYIPITHDTYTAEAPAEYEIIVGNTSREGGESIDNLDSYSIKISGKKVYINGGSAHATAMGVSEFAKLLKKGAVSDSDSVASGSYATAVKAYDKTTQYVPTWNDDFDTLDRSKWEVRGNDYQPAEGVNGMTSLRSNDPQDVYVKEGKLYLCARMEGQYLYGAKLESLWSMSYKYGYSEISAMVPHGDGFWAGFWTGSIDDFSSVDPSQPIYTKPEIDIMEMFGNSKSYAGNCHAWPSDWAMENLGYQHTSLDSDEYGKLKEYTLKDDGKKLADDFHTYGFYWDPQYMGFTCDGDLFFMYDTSTTDSDREAFNYNMYLILSLATGFANSPLGTLTMDTDDWNVTNKFIIDWLYVYQKADGVHLMNYAEVQ